MRTLLIALVTVIGTAITGGLHPRLASAADFKDVNPNVFGPDDPRTKDLPKMMWNDAKRRMQEANLRESKGFADVTTKEQWEAYRDARIKALRDSLGWLPREKRKVTVWVTKKFEGEGFVIHNILYGTGEIPWISANLYLPAKPPEKMPGILISHAHHTPKTQGELQDMGMTWARAGCAVLVPDHLGHGERRTHDFKTEKDYDKPFRVSRQDYYFRYNTNLQYSAQGGGLMTAMVGDLMLGVDVLFQQRTIDKDRIILLGAVAGGGDPAGVTAALDSRITCVAPFNFGGWQPESSVLENSDRDFAWFGDGYWESTRGLRNGARDGFAHFVIVGSVAPRKVIYAHEFAWDPKTDPAWSRLQKIFGFYDAKDNLRVAHGAGTVRDSGPGNTHCTHIGAVHRKMIYPALKDWFGMPIPEEYSKRRTTDELLCWTPEFREKFNFIPFPGDRANAPEWLIFPGDQLEGTRKAWAARLGDITPNPRPKVTERAPEQLASGPCIRFILDVEPGIVVPGLLLLPKDAKGKVPVVVMVAQAGKAGFLKERGEAITAFLNAGVAVCLPDVRGTGETQPGTSAGRGSTRTTVSQTNLILGQPVIGSQLRDLRTVIRWMQGKEGIDGKRLLVWGDSFAKVNAKDANLKVPLDAAEFPHIAEPGGDLLALLAGLYEKDVKAVYTRGGLSEDHWAEFKTRPVHLPHDAVVPDTLDGTDVLRRRLPDSFAFRDALVTSENRETRDKPQSPTDGAKWMIEQLRGKK